MSNGYQNPTVYTNECLASLENELTFSKRVERKYDDKFANEGGKIGDTLNIRRPARFTVSSGAGISTQDYTETSIPLVINSQKHIDTTFTSSDLTLKVEDFQSRIIKPKMIQLANQIDQDGLENAAKTVGNLVGTAGTSPNNVSFLFDAGQKLDEFSAPRDGERYALFDAKGNATMVASMTGFFNDPRSVSSQFKDAVFVDGTNTIGFKVGMSQNVYKQTTGPRGGTPVIAGAAQGLTAGWANTMQLATDGWTAAAAARVAAGDVFTITGINAVNPVTRQSTGNLMQFTVLATSTLSSDAGGLLTLTVSPCIISAGPFQNVTASPADGIAMTFVGTASTAYARHMTWHKSAFAMGCVDLVDVSQYGAWGARKQYNGVSLRVARQYAISTDTTPTRVDILYGWATPYPELACQLIGA